MTPTEGIAILALVGYAIYRQSQVSEVTQRGRFKLAIIYAIVGVCVGGFNLPSGAAGVGIVAGSLVLSVVIGLFRGRLTRLWVQPDGRIMQRGTAVTIGLFLALIVVKVGVGVFAGFAHIDDGEGFGEVMVMIAAMVAVQAELVWRRARQLRGPSRAAAASAPSAEIAAQVR